MRRSARYYWTLDDIDCGLITDQNRDDVVAKFDEMVGVKALDEYTVEYTLDSSAPYFLFLMKLMANPEMAALLKTLAQTLK